MSSQRDEILDKMRRAQKKYVKSEAVGGKKRVRPTTRARRRKEQNRANPMPEPPKRRPRRKTGSKKAKADEETRLEMENLETRFDNLEEEAQLAAVYQTIGNIDTMLVDLPFALETLRDRSYIHSGQLEDKLAELDDRWDDVRPRVESNLRTQVKRLDKEVAEVERQVDNMRPTASVIKRTSAMIKGLDKRIDAARRSVEGLYEGLEDGLNEVKYAIDKVEKMLDAIDESQDIRLRDTEGPLLAVPTQWQQNDDEGPEGILVLTDQRLLFEQREEVVTKKRFGIFKADSEMVQELLLDVAVHEIESISHKEEGGFLGMGKDDILELVLAATAPVSRARFHLKGQDSADWAAMIKRIQTGDIDKDRADAYLEELEEAATVAAAFPTQCPSCMATLPEPPRGVSSIACDFCGTRVTPEAA